jgi:hypothetical protein
MAPINNLFNTLRVYYILKLEIYGDLFSSTINSAFFRLYLSEMALDDDHVDGKDIEVAITFLIFTILFAFSIRFAYFFRVSKVSAMKAKNIEDRLRSSDGVALRATCYDSKITEVEVCENAVNPILTDIDMNVAATTPSSIGTKGDINISI